MDNKKKKENGCSNGKKSSGYPFDCGSFDMQGMMQMMRQCCEGNKQTPGCCADMATMWNTGNNTEKAKE
jgi:hypothetical protein